MDGRGVARSVLSGKPMRQKTDLEKKSKEEIAAELNDHLEKIQEEMNGQTPPRGLRAQLLIRELERRDQGKQANIMIVCTIVITVLTAVLVWRSITAGC